MSVGVRDERCERGGHDDERRGERVVHVAVRDARQRVASKRMLEEETDQFHSVLMLTSDPLCHNQSAPV